MSEQARTTVQRTPGRETAAPRTVGEEQARPHVLALPRRWRLRALSRDPALLAALLLVLAFVAAAAVPRLFTAQSPDAMDIPARLAPPSSRYVFGTDEFGRDIWTRLVYGAQVAMVVALLSMSLAVVIGVPLGLIAGWYGGPIDSVLMRLQDAILAFPTLLFAILVVALLGPSALTVVLTMWIVYVPRFARLVRAHVLLLKGMEFVVAAQALGASGRRIMLRHLLPNIVPTILVQSSLGMAFAILTEASLSYLGLGVQPPAPTWGSMLRVAQRYAHDAPWYVLAPGGAIFCVVLLLNFIGDRLRDHLDPRLRRGGE